MTDKIAAKVARSFFKGQATAFEPRDPLYETSVNPQTGKRKRTQRPLPPGLSKHEEKILKKIRKRAHYLDKGFSICGFRFGWTFLIGFIPVVGDAADAALSYYLVIRPARTCNLPALLVQRMFLNQIVATSIGLVPIVGDIIMAIWKVNSRNAALFEDFITLRAQHAVDASQPNGVTPSETAALAENSTRTAYIDGITGDREPLASGLNPGQSPSAGPSQAANNSENTDANKIRKPSQGWFKLKK
ncbi:hypothetical protein PGTUg99_017775 [Puccinia graminis f. sp. tritici]|uniref:DUF4112 domain-containing protein n=1 Tax=Puccinia graminis f. sp. tritici TaxID=56615 RepID=A0A5B0QKP0_PUCGR|nr:hypothetical protein PGTUg99_017775 [Puccinia graminis f. sp. tritici]